MFNEYFVNVATNKSVDNISNNPTAINNLSSVYGEIFPQIQMASVTTKEIKDIIKFLPSKNSSDTTKNTKDQYAINHILSYILRQ